MTELKCNAIHCLSNRDNRCCRPAIDVGEDGAVEQQQTCCESFRNICSNTTNAVDYSHTNANMPIKCSATNCVYNKNRECEAQSVQVEGYSAEEMKQTACATFQLRGDCKSDCGCGCR